MQFSQKIYDLQSFSKLNLTNPKIGILGGSFNPPHVGHLAISLKALEIGLDYVMWLVVPQNGFKPPYKFTLGERTDLCAEISQEEDRIIIANWEMDIKTTNSYDTLEYITSHFPNIRFTWLMGVDCLKEFHLWENYDKIPQLVDIIIFNRKGYTDLLQGSIAGKELQNLYNGKINFIPDILSDLSSTEIRNKDLQ